MSRTDKTDPYFVKVRKYGREVHHHDTGVCELVNEPGRLRDQGVRGQDQCYMDYEWWKPIFHCGCYYCRPGAYGDSPRARRRNARRECRDWDKEY